MKRLTTNKEAREMTGIELAHNCMYSYDGWARFRSFDRDDDLFDFIREFSKAENEGLRLPADNEVAADMLMDGLQYGIDNPFGRVALVYNLMWAMADLRETLMAYEDTGLAPEEIMGYKEAAEKQRAKKPNLEGDGYADGHMVYDTWICPCCGISYEIDYDDYKYCPDCGQHIDWSE